MNKCKLGDLLTIKHGFPFKGELFSDEGEYIVLTPGNFYETGGFKRIIGKEKYYLGTFPREYLCKKGDFIVAMTQQAEGLLGSTAFVPEDNIYLHNQRIGLISVNEQKADKYYLDYLFRTNEVRKQIRDSATGSKVKHTSPDRIYDVEVYVHSLAVQKRIGALLHAIDSKIRNNNKTCLELESMAKTIYDYWFLQFEFPNEDGKPYKSSGGKMVWNEELKREIPEGWKVGNLYDIAEFINGLACQKYRPINENRKIPVIKIKEMHEGISDNTEYVREDIPAKNIVNDGDILFSWSATLETMIWTGGKGGLNQHIFKIIPKEYAKYYVYMQLSAYIINFVHMAEARKTTMGHITTDHLKQSRIALPPKKITDMYDEKVQGTFNKIICNSRQDRELILLRDFLLPLLMNGQVGFKN